MGDFWGEKGKGGKGEKVLGFISSNYFSPLPLFPFSPSLFLSAIYT
jgi:hypothetical protein